MTSPPKPDVVCFDVPRELREQFTAAGLTTSDGPTEVLQLRARVDDLLQANNRYLEDARAARRKLAEAKSLNALLVRQLVTMREALEFYADDDLSNDARETDAGTTAEQALQDVLGYNRPAMEPKPTPPSAEPEHHATAACRAVGMCGAIDKPGKQACILPLDHEGAHGWDL